MTDNDRIYRGLARRLADQTGASCFFNGSVSYCDNGTCATLRCTLIIRRERITAPDGIYEKATDAVPVWWEFITERDGRQVENELSWEEFRGQLLRSL